MIRTLFRFSIRDMLWLTAVVALAVTWWVEHRGHAECRKDLSYKTTEVEMMETYKPAWELTLKTYGIEEPNAYVVGRGFYLRWKDGEPVEPRVHPPADWQSN